MFASRALDYMVATDAIAMGLNLNANRMVFQTLAKRHKNKVLPISGNDIQQLATNIKPWGRISAFNKGDLKLIRNALLPAQKGGADVQDRIKKACVFPSF